MGNKLVQTQKLTLRQKVIGYSVLSLAGVILFGLVVVWPVGHFVNTHFTGTKICTVVSSELDDSSSGKGTPTPSRSLTIESSDCGPIVITSVKSPNSMNQASLNAFFNEHQGQKFEFITEYFQFPDSLGSFGITSTEPVK